MTNKTLFKGNLKPEDLIFREIKSTRKIDKDLEKLTAGKWGEIVEKARSENRKIWDSEVCRLEKVISNDKTTLWVSTIKYSARIAMREFTGEIKKLGLKYAPMGMCSSCFIKTLDNKYLFIEKSDKYFSTRKYSFVGGVLSKSEKEIKNGKDLFESVKKEINEETKVSSKNISPLILKAGYITETFNFCLVFEAGINKTYKEISENFKKSNAGGGEASSVVEVDQNLKINIFPDITEGKKPNLLVNVRGQKFFGSH